MSKENLNKQDVNEVEAGPDLPKQIAEVGWITQMEHYLLMVASLFPMCRGADNWWRPVNRSDVDFPRCMIEKLLKEGLLQPVGPGELGPGARRHEDEDFSRVRIVDADVDASAMAETGVDVSPCVGTKQALGQRNGQNRPAKCRRWKAEG
jgi:hypothetical protein